MYELCRTLTCTELMIFLIQKIIGVWGGASAPFTTMYMVVLSFTVLTYSIKTWFSAIVTWVSLFLKFAFMTNTMNFICNRLDFHVFSFLTAKVTSLNHRSHHNRSHHRHRFGFLFLDHKSYIQKCFHGQKVGYNIYKDICHQPYKPCHKYCNGHMIVSFLNPHKSNFFILFDGIPNSICCTTSFITVINSNQNITSINHT